MKYLILSLVLVSILLPVVFSLAEEVNLPITEPKTESGLVQESPESTLGNVFAIVFKVLTILAGALAVVMFAWAGIEVIWKKDPGKAKDALLWGAVGLVIALVSYALVVLISGFAEKGTL